MGRLRLAGGFVDCFVILVVVAVSKEYLNRVVKGVVGCRFVIWVA